MNAPEVRKRVLMLLENNSFPEDNRVFLEAETLAQAGFDVSVICPTGASRKRFEKVGDIRVYRYPGMWEPGGFLGYILEYAYSITMLFLFSAFVGLRHGFDVVHVHTPPDLAGVIAIFYQFLGKRFVFDHHDLSPELYLARRGDDKPNIIYKALRFFERLACRHADRLIATNVTQQNVQIQRCAAIPDHCHIVRNGPEQCVSERCPAKTRITSARTNRSGVRRRHRRPGRRGFHGARGARIKSSA